MVVILHISDLHFVTNAASYHTEEILVQEAARKVKNVPRGKKLLIITGDFHNFWEKDYDKAAEFIKRLICKMDIEMEQDVFVVPGNHDVGNDDALKPLLEPEDPLWKEHKKSCLAMLKTGDKEYLYERLQAFRLYNKFVQNIGIYDIDKGEDFPASSHVRSWRGKLNILHLNSALIADGNQKDNQMTDVDTAANPETWEHYYDKRIPAIAIGHNNYYDIINDQRLDLALTFYQKNVSAYLCGDRHRTEQDPEHQMIRIESGQKQGEEIPNLVAAKGIADGDDTYSEVGYCWHYWDEESDKVTVEFRKWTKSNLGNTVSAGETGEYYMRREKTDEDIRGELVQSGENPNEIKHETGVVENGNPEGGTKEDKNIKNIVCLVALIAIVFVIIIIIMALKSSSTENLDNISDEKKFPMNIDSYVRAVESYSGKEVVQKNYDDYDGDGKNEMFALVKDDDSINDNFILEKGTLWFVNQYEVYALSDLPKRYQKDMSTIKLGKNKFLNVTEYYDTGALSYLWGMKEGQPFEYNISTQPNGLKVNDYNEVEIIGEDFSAVYDKRIGMGMGHTWITYYLYFDGNDFYEYGGKLISWDEFCRIPGIQDVLEKIDAEMFKEGWTVDKIFYRDNGIVNVNFRVEDEDIIQYKNMTMRIWKGDIVDCRFGDGEVLKVLMENVATYPEKFPY